MLVQSNPASAKHHLVVTVSRGFLRNVLDRPNVKGLCGPADVILDVIVAFLATAQPATAITEVKKRISQSDIQQVVTEARVTKQIIAASGAKSICFVDKNTTDGNSVARHEELHAIILELSNDDTAAWTVAAANVLGKIAEPNKQRLWSLEAQYAHAVPADATHAKEEIIVRILHALEMPCEVPDSFYQLMLIVPGKLNKNTFTKIVDSITAWLLLKYFGRRQHEQNKDLQDMLVDEIQQEYEHVGAPRSTHRAPPARGRSRKAR